MSFLLRTYRFLVAISGTLGWGLVSAVIDGLPLGFVAIGKLLRLKIFRLVEGQVSKPKNTETNTCFSNKAPCIYLKKVAGQVFPPIAFLA
jgi:hypothetical protein